MIHKKYPIGVDTLAIFPAKNPNYQAKIILENNKHVMVKRSPTEIIKDSCRHYLVNYECEKKISQRVFNFLQKSPIRVNPHLLIYMFPTRSDRHKDVIWINADKIEKKKKNKNKSRHTDIIFTCDTKITVDVSLYTINNQHDRSLQQIVATSIICGIDINNKDSYKKVLNYVLETFGANFLENKRLETFLEKF